MTTQRDDDYLICRHYKEHIDQVSPDYPGFITFEHNDNHYFAWVHDGQIVLRSEAYPDQERMERGIKAIIKNKDIPERYTIDTQHGVHFLVLWGGGNHQKHTGNMESHNEIGRSCPVKDRKDLYALMSFLGPAMLSRFGVNPNETDYISGAAKAAGAAGAAIAGATSLAGKTESTPSRPKVERTNKTRKSSPGKAATAAAITSSTSKGSSSASKSSAKTSTGGGATRATAGGAASAGGNSGGGGGGFKWWWLLPFLLIPLFFMWKGCNKDGDAKAKKAKTETSNLTGTAKTDAASVDAAKLEADRKAKADAEAAEAARVAAAQKEAEAARIAKEKADAAAKAKRSNEYSLRGNKSSGY